MVVKPLQPTKEKTVGEVKTRFKKEKWYTLLVEAPANSETKQGWLHD